MDYATSMRTSHGAIDSIGEEVGKSMNLEKRMKKKVFRFSQEMLDHYLSVRPRPISRKRIERDPHRAAEMDKVRQRILTEQERIRREYEAKGYATYVVEVPDDGTRYEREVNDDEEEEKDAAGVGKQAEAIINEKNEEDTSVAKQVEDIIDEKKEDDTSVAKQAEAIIDENYEEATSVAKQAEVTADENKEKDAATEAEATNSATPLNFPQGRGRRRFRPGIVKQAGGSIKKIVM